METPGKRVAGSVLAGAVLVVGLGWTAPAAADDQAVEVRDNAFAAREVEVRSGERVVWSWVGSNRHSVTSDAGTTPLYAFDSDPDCADAEGQRVGCRSRNDPDYQDFVWTAPLVDEVTTITYHCKLHVGQNMIGTVRVRPPLEPPASEEPSDGSEPGSEPDGGTASESPTSDDGQGGGSGGSSPSPSAPGDASEGSGDDASGEPRPVPSHGTAGRPPSSFGPPGPIETHALPTITPTAAPAVPEVAEPDLEEFPGPPSTTSTPDEVGTVSIEAPSDGGGLSSRAIWLGIGSASILVAAGAFAKLVLFGAPWG